jgi:hypothetical protein
VSSQLEPARSADSLLSAVAVYFITSGALDRA